MSSKVTGYQWSPTDNKFVGAYEFPDNLDKAPIHLPPHTTLTPPPALKAGEQAVWGGQSWSVVPVPAENRVTAISRELYGNILPDFAAQQVSLGLWSADEFAVWQAAYATAQAQRESDAAEQQVKLDALVARLRDQNAA